MNGAEQPKVETANAAPAPEPTPKEQPKPVGQAALDALKMTQAAAAAKAQEANEKIQKRANEMKGFVGKTYEPILPTRGENQTLKITDYEGIRVIPDGHPQAGQLAHMFRIESKAPEYVLVTPATQFLQEHKEIEVEEPHQSQEVI